MICKEFSIINKYFNRQKESTYVDVEIGIGDDCAILHPKKGEALVISTDTLVSGKHFLQDFDPASLANKAVSVNISDIAAMGAYPSWITLALTLSPEINESWLKSFSEALFTQLSHYNIQLIGGDTTAGPLSITITICGFVPKGFALKRSGARPGEWIYVTGTLGDSAAGLAILQNRLKIKDINDELYLINRHKKPTPRILHGRILLQYASSAIDLSDGLKSDIKHILKASRVGARIELDTFPLSFAMQKHIDQKQAINWALTGGEDYELLFTVPERHRSSLEIVIKRLGSVPITCIGQVLTEDKGLNFTQNGKRITNSNWKTYEHFT